MCGSRPIPRWLSQVTKTSHRAAPRPPSAAGSPISFQLLDMWTFMHVVLRTYRPMRGAASETPYETTAWRNLVRTLSPAVGEGDQITQRRIFFSFWEMVVGARGFLPHCQP